MSDYWDFEGYRIQIHEDSKGSTVTILNPQYTKRYSCSISELEKQEININTFKAAISKTNDYVKLNLQEKEDQLEIIITIEAPFFSPVCLTFKCSNFEHFDQAQTNLIILESIKKKYQETRQLIQENPENRKSSILFSYYNRVKQPYDQLGNYTQISENYDSFNCSLNLGQLQLEPSTRYLLTLSCFAQKLQTLYCFSGRYNSPRPLFSDPENTIYYMNQNYQFENCFAKQVIETGETNQPFKVFAYQNGLGTEFRNVVITAEKLGEYK